MINVANVLTDAYREAVVVAENVPDARKLSATNYALSIICRDLKPLESVDSPTLVAGQQEYPLPTVGSTQLDQVAEWEFIGYRINTSVAWRKLPQADDRLRFNYVTTTGEPIYWYERYEGGTPVFGLIPAPDAATAAGLLTRQFAYNHPQVTSLTEDIDLPVELQRAIMLIVASQFAGDDGEIQLSNQLRNDGLSEKNGAAETLSRRTMATSGTAPSFFNDVADQPTPSDMYPGTWWGG